MTNMDAIGAEARDRALLEAVISDVEKTGLVHVREVTFSHDEDVPSLNCLQMMDQLIGRAASK